MKMMLTMADVDCVHNRITTSTTEKSLLESCMECLFVTNAYPTCLYMQTYSDTCRFNREHIQRHTNIQTDMDTCRNIHNAIQYTI